MRTVLAVVLTLSLPALALAGPADFKTGPIIEGFGPVAVVSDAQALPKDAHFKVSFDTGKGAEGEALNRTLESAARFINMHGAAGVTADNIDVAVVVHGGAAFDLLTPEAYKAARDGTNNPNISLIKALNDAGVRIILCGQTAAYRDFGADDLLPGVELSLSAMTSHAQLQQDGYTLNPF